MNGDALSLVLGDANSNASSPSTNTGVCAEKCTATTAPPAAIVRTRSAREGSAVWSSDLMRTSAAIVRERIAPTDGRSAIKSRDAALEALADFVLRQIAADEDDAAFALLAARQAR